MASPLVFVNHQIHIDGIKANRRVVAIHIGKHHRNRSKPSKLFDNGASSGSTASHQRKHIAPKVSSSVEQHDGQPATSGPYLEQPQPSASTISLRPIYHLPPINVPPQIDSHRLDPFQTGVVRMTADMEPVFMYYLSTIMPVVEPAPQERAEYQQWLVPLAMSDPALLYALLRCMTLDIEQASMTSLGTSRRKATYPAESQYKAHGTRALNQSLANPVQAARASTMMAVHFWLWQEIFSGEECITMDEVRRLLDFRGGFASIQRKGIEAVMVGSFWHAIRTATSPQLSIILAQPVTPIERLAEITLNKYPTISSIGMGLLQPELVRHFDEGFYHILQEIRCVWICYELIGAHDFEVSEERSITISRMKVDHRLLSYPFEQKLSPSSVQEACRWALVLYSVGHYNVVQPSSKIARCLVGNLQNVLKATDMRSCWQAASGTLLWILLLGAHMSLGQQERPWFVAALSKVARKAGQQQWVQVEESLRLCYFSDRVYGGSFRAIWAEVRSLALLFDAWQDEEPAVNH